MYFRRKPKTTARKVSDLPTWCISSTYFVPYQLLDQIEQRRATNLLDVPIHRLMEELSVSTAQKLTHADAAAAAASASSASRTKEEPEEDLWVDRYRPRRYMDLLGDERVHRETLGWVKEWDFCVFGKKKAKGKAAKRPWNDDAVQEEEVEWKKDEFKRPREKILLMSGPPGLGKTTLAHVVARQAGYTVFEINAR